MRNLSTAARLATVTGALAVLLVAALSIAFDGLTRSGRPSASAIAACIERTGLTAVVFHDDGRRWIEYGDPEAHLPEGPPVERIAGPPVDRILLNNADGIVATVKRPESGRNSVVYQAWVDPRLARRINACVRHARQK